MGAYYLYAIADQPERPLEVSTGLTNAEIQLIAYRELVAVVSPLAGGAPAPAAANVLLHERVIEALMAERTVLPARYGMTFKNSLAAREELATRYSAYMTNLDRVRGRVELGLRVLWYAPTPPLAEITSEQRSSGRSYLMARLAEERRAQAERCAAEARAAALAERLAALAVEYVAEVLVTPRTLLKAAYLVDRAQLAAFQQAVQALQASDAVLRFLCTGPWPAYHFVTASNEAEVTR